MGWLSDVAGKSRGKSIALAMTLIGSLAFGVSTAAADSTNITGTWNCCGAGGAAAQDFLITDSGGSLSGTGVAPSGGVFADITGSVSGDDVTIVTTYNDFAPGYVATFTGTISADGTTMSGDWSSSWDQSGTWTATRSGFEVSGHVYDQQCTEDSCSQAGLSGIDVLVTGKDDDGNDVSETDDSADDGSWSVFVPDGTYEAGPTDDGSTFIGPVFDPESIPDIEVDGADVDGKDFTTCAAGGKDDSGAAGTDASNLAPDLDAANDGIGARVVPHNSSTYTASLCKSQYTITLSARIPATQIVDPSLQAPYNRASGRGQIGWGEQTGVPGLEFFGNGLDSLLETYPHYPACGELYGKDEAYQEEHLNGLPGLNDVYRWYTYMSGGSLGTVTIPLVFNQAQGDDGTVFFGSKSPSETTGSLTRTWVAQEGKFLPPHKIDWFGTVEKCSVTAKISALATIVPGGNDKRGLVNDNAFTIVVLWYFPFSPPGYVVPSNTTAATIIKGRLGDKEGDEVVETFEHMPWISRFSFTAVLGTGVVKSLEGGAAVAKGIKTTSETVESLEKMGSMAEKLHSYHSVFDTSTAGAVNIVNLLTGDHYPVMGAVIRGVFKSTPNPLNAKLISSTSLAMTVAKSNFPDINLQVTRQAKPNNDASCPQTGAPQVLPWAADSFGCPRVFNPYSSQPTDMLSMTSKSLTRGAAAVTQIFEDTRGLDSLADQPRYVEDVFDSLGPIQSLVAPPTCDPDKGPTTQQSNTICWVFTDGRP